MLKQSFKIILLCAIFFTFSAFAKSKKEGKFEKKLSVGNAVSLKIFENFGNVKIGSKDDNVVLIKAKIKNLSKDKKSGKELADRITKNPPIVVQDDFVTIGDPETQGKDYSIDYEITTPKKISLEMNLGAGNVTVQNIEGKILIDNKTGNVKLKDITGSVSVRAGSGNVAIKKVTGNSKVETDGGNITISKKSSKKS